MNDRHMQIANALRSYTQADMEGVVVNVSRQACEEGANLIENIQRMLVIAYSAGKEQGHHETVEGCFYGNGRNEAHDEAGIEWVLEATEEGEFTRDLNA